MKQLIGLIGNPLTHSISPYFQQAAFDSLKLDIGYQLWQTIPADLKREVEKLRSADFIGANVTTPYKEAVIELLDDVDKLSSIVGSVNTIVNRESKLIGLNTDVYGFSYSLKNDALFEIKGKKVLIIGAGGAAKAAVYALIDEGASKITITNRTLEKAKAISEHFIKYCNLNNRSVVIEYVPYIGENPGFSVEKSGLVINCTTVGMKYTDNYDKSPVNDEIINSEMLVYDLVYNPIETRLLSVAKKRGARTLNGLSMLVYQGAKSFELWTNEKAPVPIMFDAARAALRD